MISIELIKNFVLRNSNLYNIIDYGYLIPKNIKSKSGRLINLEQNRNNALINNQSSFSINFESDLYNNYNQKIFSYIKELPIVIDDKNLWNDILDGLGDPKNSKSRDINYFLLDFYFIHLNINIEIDSILHRDKGIYDKARDIYLNCNFGIDTMRFYNYGDNNKLKSLYLQNFENIANFKINCMKNWGIDTTKECCKKSLSDIIVNLFIQDNYRSLEFIEKLINYIGLIEFCNNNKIAVTYKDIINIDNTLTIKELKKKGSLDRLFIEGVILLVLQIYNKKLEVT